MIFSPINASPLQNHGFWACAIWEGKDCVQNPRMEVILFQENLCNVYIYIYICTYIYPYTTFWSESNPCGKIRTTSMLQSVSWQENKPDNRQSPIWISKSFGIAGFSSAKRVYRMVFLYKAHPYAPAAYTVPQRGVNVGDLPETP